MVEHAAVNRVVEGSSPSSGAIILAPVYGAFFKEDRPLSVKLSVNR